MSKSDAMRAMREARYERAAAARSAGKPKETAKKTQRVAAPSTGTKPRAADPVAEDIPNEGLCGHRSISGRTCTRDLGHAAKSHRYS